MAQKKPNKNAPQFLRHFSGYKRPRKVRSIAPSGVHKLFCTISGSRYKSKLLEAIASLEVINSLTNSLSQWFVFFAQNFVFLHFITFSSWRFLNTVSTLYQHLPNTLWTFSTFYELSQHIHNTFKSESLLPQSHLISCLF